MIPVLLVKKITVPGFVYFMSAYDVAGRVVPGHFVLWIENKTIQIQ